MSDDLVIVRLVHVVVTCPCRLPQLLGKWVLHVVVQDARIVGLLLGLSRVGRVVKVGLFTRDARETVLVVEGVLVEREDVLSEVRVVVARVIVGLEREVVRLDVCLHFLFFVYFSLFIVFLISRR